MTMMYCFSYRIVIKCVGNRTLMKMKLRITLMKSWLKSIKPTQENHHLWMQTLSIQKIILDSQTRSLIKMT